jgi:hypothetical protein
MAPPPPPPPVAAPPPIMADFADAFPSAPAAAFAAPAGGSALEELPGQEAPGNPGVISVAFFFPRGRMAELGQLKQKFQDIIRKHKLKFEMHPGLEAGYPADQTLTYTAFLEACQRKQMSIAIVLGPPPDGRLQETIFHQRLQDTFEPNEISLQFIPWDELGKDYRYLNISLDITLIRFNKGKGKR